MWFLGAVILLFSSECCFYSSHFFAHLESFFDGVPNSGCTLFLMGSVKNIIWSCIRNNICHFVNNVDMIHIKLIVQSILRNWISCELFLVKKIGYLIIRVYLTCNLRYWSKFSSSFWKERRSTPKEVIWDIFAAVVMLINRFLCTLPSSCDDEQLMAYNKRPWPWHCNFA